MFPPCSLVVLKSEHSGFIRNTIYRLPAALCCIFFSVSQGSWIVPMTRLFFFAFFFLTVSLCMQSTQGFPKLLSTEESIANTYICLAKAFFGWYPGERSSSSGREFFFTSRQTSLDDSFCDFLHFIFLFLCIWGERRKCPHSSSPLSKKKKKSTNIFFSITLAYKNICFIFKYPPFQTMIFFSLTASLKLHSLPWLLALSFHLTV